MGEVVIRPFREEDAAGLAELLNASDNAWPGTFTGGIAYTVERVLAHRREGDYLLDLVAEVEGNIVGTCTLTRDWADPHAVYVAFLNVHPDWHGRGIGKRLLLATLEEAARFGVPYVTLNTWSGNERAIPLYKKTGFFWVPRTDVRMENYLPRILKLPWVEDFLGAAHWYECLKREITLEEDREKWRGREIFRYVFEREGERLEVVIDRAAKAPCALFAPGLSVELWPEPSQPWTVLPFKLRWHIVNLGRTQRIFALSARGDPGIEISGGELFALKPGEGREGEYWGSAASDLRVEPHRPFPAARLDLLVEGGTVEFSCGIGGRFPLEVSWGPSPLFVRPNAPVSAKVYLVNRHEGALEGKLFLSPDEGLNLEPHCWEFHLSPGETRVLDVSLKAQPGGHVLNGNVELSSDKTWVIPPLSILSREPGQAVGCTLRDRALMAGDWGWLEARARGGRLIFFRYREAHPALRQGEEIGPPFFPVELGQRRWGLGLEQAAGGVRLIMETDSGRFPGVKLRKEVFFSSGNQLEISYSLSSNREKPLSVQMRVAHWDLPDRPWRVSFRAPEGLVSNPLEAFPEGEGDFPEELAEDWLALETEGWTIGFVPGEEVRWDCDWGWSWKTAYKELRPGKTVALHRYLLYLGPGDFPTVRAIWSARTGKPLAEERPQPFVWVEPQDAVLVGEDGELSFRVRTGRGQPFSGTLSLRPPSGLSLERTEVEVRGVTREKPAELHVRWRREGELRAGVGELVLQGMGEERRFPWSVILISQTKPEVREGEREGRKIVSVSAGKTEFQVAPAFAASLISWKEEGQEWLLSAFPEPQSFVWLSPWFGGIHPFLHELSLDEWNWPGRLYREEFRGEPWSGEVEGTPLVGVRLVCEPKGEGLQGLSVEIIYATPAEGILISLMRVGNSGYPRRLSGGFLGFLAPGGDFRDTVLRAPGLTRIRSPYHAWCEARDWASVEASSGEAILCAVSPPSVVAIWDAGEEGKHLGVTRDFELSPEEKATIAGIWVAFRLHTSLDPWLSLARLLATK